MKIDEMSAFEKGVVYQMWKDLFELSKKFHQECECNSSLLRNPVLAESLERMYSIVKSLSK
jgi:hypothetical protein